jgi:hypothetical protein
MNEKTKPGLSTASCCSQEKTEYVLEDVFWVPISNCRARHLTLPGRLELHSERLDITEVRSLEEAESSASSTPASLVQRPTIRNQVRTRFNETKGKRGRLAVTDGENH